MFFIKWRKERQDRLHDILDCLIGALEAKDPYTSGHSTRVADMSLDLAKELGLRGKALDEVHMAAHLHDIGKMGISEKILNKNGRLLPEELVEMEKHPSIGYDILMRVRGLAPIAEIVLGHHERWDGAGYPLGRKGDEVSLGARIIGVADAIDAMTSQRVYKKPLGWDSCRREVLRCSGTQFDPQVVQASLRLFRKWEKEFQENEDLQEQPVCVII